MIDDKILMEDLSILANSQIPMKELKNKSILITGSTGMIGSQIVKALLYFNEHKNTQTTIYAHARSEIKAKKVFGSLLDNKNLKMIYGDIQNPINISGKLNYIIHGASITSSKDFVTNPVDTIRIAIDGSVNIFELARSKEVESVVYLSSLEVYGVLDDTHGDIREDDYGYIDHLNVRSSYSESKRMVECLCTSYTAQYNLPIKIARLSQTFGAGVDYDDNRVFAQFARSAIEGKDIVLHTKGDTYRSYCYTRDAIKAIFYILLKGKNANAYNVSNMNTAISIRDMAEMVSKKLSKSKINVIYKIEEIEKHGYNPTVKAVLNTEEVEKLGWYPEVGLEEMFERMITSMLVNRDSKTV